MRFLATTTKKQPMIALVTLVSMATAAAVSAVAAVVLAMSLVMFLAIFLVAAEVAAAQRGVRICAMTCS